MQTSIHKSWSSSTTIGIIMVKWYINIFIYILYCFERYIYTTHKSNDSPKNASQLSMSSERKIFVRIFCEAFNPIIAEPPRLLPNCWISKPMWSCWQLAAVVTIPPAVRWWMDFVVIFLGDSGMNLKFQGLNFLTLKSWGIWKMSLYVDFVLCGCLMV